jgi:hypothetical protein
MNSLRKLSVLIEKYTNIRNFVVMLVLFVLVTGTMEVCPFGSVHLRNINNGVGMLDMLSGGYSSSLVYSMFERIGEAGRISYAQLLGLDVVFALVYMCLLSLLTTLLLRGSGIDNQWKLLNLLPVARSGLDLLENSLLLALLFSYPARLDLLVNIASAVTITKWVIYIIILALLAVLGIYAAIKKILARFWPCATPGA